MHRILLLTGMTPDHRIFSRLLPLLPTATIVDWIRPMPCESITAYATRLSHHFEPDQPTVVCGVSFGGIVAREFAARLNARACVLVSSVRAPSELPPWFRICRHIPPATAAAVMNAVGTLATFWPPKLKSSATWRLTKLAGDAGQWHRWAASAVLTWKPSVAADLTPLLHIHGDRDTTFPIRYTKPDTVIRGGGHVLALTHYDQIAAALRQIAAS